MSSHINEEEISSHQNYIIKASVHQQTLRLKIISSSQDRGTYVYSVQIASLDDLGELFKQECFNIQQVKNYLRKSGHYQIDFNALKFVIKRYGTINKEKLFKVCEIPMKLIEVSECNFKQLLLQDIIRKCEQKEFFNINESIKLISKYLIQILKEKDLTIAHKENGIQKFNILEANFNKQIITFDEKSKDSVKKIESYKEKIDYSIKQMEIKYQSLHNLHQNFEKKIFSLTQTLQELEKQVCSERYEKLKLSEWKQKIEDSLEQIQPKLNKLSFKVTNWSTHIEKQSRKIQEQSKKVEQRLIISELKNVNIISQMENTILKIRQQSRLLSNKIISFQGAWKQELRQKIKQLQNNFMVKDIIQEKQAKVVKNLSTLQKKQSQKSSVLIQNEKKIKIQKKQAKGKQDQDKLHHIALEKSSKGTNEKLSPYVEQLIINSNQKENIRALANQADHSLQKNIEEQFIKAVGGTWSELNKKTSLNVGCKGLTQLPIKICELIQLTVLDVSNNKLIYLPDTLSSLTQLNYLYISNNNLNLIPDSLSALKNLQCFYFRGNPLKKLPNFLPNLQKLKQVSLDLTMLPTPKYLQCDQLNQIKNITINIWYKTISEQAKSILRKQSKKRNITISF